MAYVNVAEWSPEHVAEWLRGLEDSILPYVHFFLNNNIDGHHLLNLAPDDLNNLHIFKIGHQELILEAVDLLRQLNFVGLEDSILPYVHFFLNNNIDGHHLLNLAPDDLNNLHIFKIGHQELILEAVDLLRQLHYSLTLETLQFLALKLGCKARSLYNELKLNGPQDGIENIKQERVSTDTLSSVSDILVSVKSFISWLDRYPFEYQDQYVKIRKAILKLSIELASTAQRDQFVEKPHSLIKISSLTLAELCDKVVQDFNDSLIIQPASLDIATIKKKPDEELGMHIQSTYSGVHIIGGIKFQSPARRCSKVEEGDEIIQVNYQTVIGWQLKKLVYAMREHSTEIHLTLKKRPRHTNILGQVIILRPHRIPSKKTAFGKVHKWSEGNSSLHIQEVYSTSNDNESPRDDPDDDDDDSAFLPDDATSVHQINLSKENPLHYRIFSPTTHATVQRRATVSGASPTVLRPPVNIEDLINGTSLMNRKETVGRSISHDPSKLSSSSENSTNIIIQVLDPIKSDDSEENMEKIHVKCEGKGENEVNTRVRNVNQELCPRPFTTIGITRSIGNNNCIENKRDRSPVPTSEIILPVQEEEYTILENKSLEKIQKNVTLEKDVINIINKEKGKVEESIKAHDAEIKSSTCDKHDDSEKMSNYEDKTISLSAEPQSDKRTTIVCPWEGADTAFCGRRPSAHDIANEVAGSKPSEINPVFLKKASKLQQSPSSENLESCAKDTKTADTYSYQVLVVGGVPQKCNPHIKNSRKGSENVLPPYKKKASIAERFGSRRISCKDLGMGDCQGWLYKQKETKGFLSTGLQWTKRWIVLKKHYLYSYRDKNGIKAECLISLPGSTVSPALECKTKKYAFKICKKEMVFYFATESQDDLTKWMNKMGLAAIAYDATSDITTSGFLKPEVILGVENTFYSETEDSDEGSPKSIRRMYNSNIHEGSPESSSLSSDHSSNDMFAKNSSKTKPSQICIDIKSKQYSANIECEKENISMEDSGKTHSNSNWIKSQVPPNPQKLHSKTSGFDYQLENKFVPAGNYILPLNYKLEKIQEVRPYTHRVAYNRSLSCTEASNSKFCGDSANLMPRKMSYEESMGGKSLPYRYDGKGNEVKNSPWLASEEEYDMLTSSLGRQKPLAKEITPGLVARMAVSYSNLSQRNAVINTASGKHNLYKGSPGYVAKMSDSFDYLAKQSNPLDTVKYETNSRQVSMSSSSSLQQPYCGYKRSASESQVSQKFYDKSSHRTVSLSSSQVPKVTAAKTNEAAQLDCVSEKFISMLDREYLRLYGRKKASEVVSFRSSLWQNNSNNDSGLKREIPCMKYFPDKAIDERKKTGNFSRGVNISNKSVTKENAMEKNKFQQSFSQFCKTVSYSESSGSVSSDGTFNEIGVQDITNFQPRHSLYNSNHFMHDDSTIQNSQLYGKSIETSKGIENYSFCFADQLKPDAESTEIENSIIESDISHIDSSSYDYGRDSCHSLEAQNSLESKIESEICMSPKAISTDFGGAKPNTSFRFFGSPMFTKKLSSPKLDKKNIFKSKKLAKEIKKAEQKELAPAQSDRKFFGSPRLARAIFGSPKPQKKVIVTVSSGVQTESVSGHTSKDNSCQKEICSNKKSDAEVNLGHLIKSERATLGSFSEVQSVAECLKSSSSSSLNSSTSGSFISASTTSSHYYVETRIKPQVTISLPLVSDKSLEDRPETPETPRASLKPTMGIAMLGKRRLPSVSGDSTVSVSSSKSSQEDAAAESVQMRSEVKMDIKGEKDEDEMIRIMEVLRHAELSLDGVDLRSRRCQTILMHFDDKRTSQLLLSLRALHRTLKDKETELAAIEELFQHSVIDHEVLVKWMSTHAHKLSAKYSSEN